jgi:hypothetical protein
VVAGSALAALASGLLLYGAGAGAGDAAPPPDQAEPLVAWARQNRVAIIAVQVLSLFAASVASAVLATRDYGRRWTEARRKAKAERIGLFEAVVDLAAQAPGTGPAGALRQALEFFRRYQLELQLNYYTKRGGEQDDRDARTAWAAAVLGGLAAVTGAIGAVGGSFAVAAAFFGIAVPILLAATRSWRNANRAAETAASYKAAAEALGRLRRGLTAVRARADLGDVPAVKDFVARVHEVMRIENGAWTGAGAVQDVPGGAAASAPAPASAPAAAVPTPTPRAVAGP